MVLKDTHYKSAVKVAIDTHGCKLNQSDTDTLIRQFVDAGYRIVESYDSPDVYVLNTCTVTHTADSKARQAIRRFSNKNPSALIVATGCYAERDPSTLNKLDGISLVIGNHTKDGLVNSVTTKLAGNFIPMQDSEEHIKGSFHGRTRAMIKIQEGCNQVCAYCIVPKVRGRERSVLPEILIEQIQSRVKEGYKEVVLTGTQLGSYGFDIPKMSLESLLELIIVNTSIPRIRVSSLQPQEFTARLMELWNDRRMCPHFHIPLQSGNDEILERMRRRYNTDQYRVALEKVLTNYPDASVTTDVIVGFPGEEADAADETFKFCQSLELSDMHIFPYSVRLGTSAAYMHPSVPSVIKRTWVQRMLDLAKIKEKTFRLRFMGLDRPVLWEKTDDKLGLGIYTGRTDNYIKVKAFSDTPVINEITSTKLLWDDNGQVFGKILVQDKESNQDLIT